MARYLGSGDGEECPLSRRVSSAGAPGPSLPRRPEALLGPRPAVSGPGRPSSAPRHCPRGPPRAPGPPRGGVPLSLGARLPSPAPAALGGRGVKGRAGRASRGERAGANAGSATRAAPLPQRRRRPGPCCCCQLVERTLSMRERRPHPVTCPCNEVPLIGELESEPSAASSPPYRVQCGAVLQPRAEAKTLKGLLTRCL
uniref:cuticle collagen 1-like isoform X2 n=1 Tax=Halichoerus grypus TaxID=9711 RepID=UPI001659EF04|nr:cuticle collagen 1-like isoform X2 [Halichoerus grypus]XP_035920647.1 cuticle collagen 1-like isoform X2 [Halichoerus grypus]XP_035920648.1 cuticle collagen 1-like isoform X2 [Halichoerus grypus]